MEKKQTAVEWLVNELSNLNPTQVEWHKAIEQAKEMEKKSLIDFHIEVMKIGLIGEGDRKWTDAYKPKIREEAEKYYEQTFAEKTPLEKVADFLGDKIEKLESIRTYKEQQKMSEADKIEERGIAQFEDDRQSNFDRE